MRSIINAINNLSMAINNLASAMNSKKVFNDAVSKPTTSNPYSANSTITSYYSYTYPQDKNSASIISNAEHKALRKIYDAITDKGPYPHHHDHIMKELKTKWPTLYKALDELIFARTNPKNKSIWKEKEL